MNQIVTLWYDQNFRRLFFQVLAVLALAYFGYFIFDNTSTNLKRLNIQPGFQFMNEIAGFMPTTDGMNFTGFDLNKSTHKDVFIVGISHALAGHRRHNIGDHIRVYYGDTTPLLEPYYFIYFKCLC